VCRCAECGSLVKPHIVFFGENLPQRFFELHRADLARCDLLIVLGTSLVVHPFAGLLHHVRADCPRLLINRDLVGDIAPELYQLGHRRGLWFGEGNTRDVQHLGDCDAVVRRLAALLGWEADLDALHALAEEAVVMAEVAVE